MRSCEKLLEGFEPDFEFKPVSPLPREEFEERIRKIRAEATEEECDALIFHTDQIGWYHTSNSYLRYVSDWIREGILILPVDEDKPSTILSFFSDSVLLPPPGEPTWIDDVRQIGTWGREGWHRSGNTTLKAAQAIKAVTDELGVSSGKLGLVGDNTSIPFWAALEKILPQTSFQNENRIINKMQLIRSKREQEIIRAAAQLLDIGIQAAYYVCKPGVTDHEIFAAFTYAQMSRGGESGDGYQIGINRYGTHISKPYGHVVQPGDIIILYISGITYRGYNDQCARMIIVGEITKKQEEVIEMCVEGVKRAMKVARPGVLMRDVNHAAFQPYIERGYLKSPDARMIPFNWEANPDGTARRIPLEHIKDETWEGMGRDLRHVYPATIGPNGPRMGHAISMPKMPIYHVISNNYMKLEPGMTFVVHAQWFEPKLAGCNVGNSLLVTENGVENLNSHSSLEPYRVKV